ncbi:mRNA-binding protein Puf2p [[Candida] jaroonii]|uniref:mRNA-binding protein Puf2p n=1 Tax=[Candida] jaroonii TaxID=467808 RepID=A0ACA9YE72_9ASCO|nr:mRNA-binding protein Puf2p [[Candida] jaroonii]
MSGKSSTSPPSISVTPSIGGSRRSRAGTLPSSFLHTPNNNLSTTAPVNFESISSTTSPLMISNNLDSLSIPSEINISSSPDFINGSHLVANSGRRVRSGSLFSNNSIWNDNNLEKITSGNSNEYISPSMNPQASSFNDNFTINDTDFQRNRSYTANATTNGLNMNNMNLNMNIMEDDFIINNNNSVRHRSQTFSGMPLNDNLILQQQQIQQLQLQQQMQQQAAQQQMNQVPQFNQSNQNQPLLYDDYDISQFVITNSFENPSLGPTNYLLFDNLPVFFNSLKLYSILANALNRNQGNIASIKTVGVSNSKISLVECSSIELAMSLKATFNHYEIMQGIILYIAFAKCNDGGNNYNNGVKNNTNVHVNNAHTSSEGDLIRPTDLIKIKDTLISTITDLNKDIDLKKIESLINKSIQFPNSNYVDNFGPLPEPIPIRQFDAPKLRELRKSLELTESFKNGELLNSEDRQKVFSQEDLDELCLAMLDELPELCYDYLGNTIVQKIFQLVESSLIKLMMIKEIAPFLTQLSIHKNGTWAIQKIINVCCKDKLNSQQKYLIGASLKPYTVKLFNDQFGNYVLQACIKFGSPFNDFLIESVLDNFLEISFGRFGSRSIRTILETSHVLSNEQILLISGLIIEYSNELVVNNNGSLLITWFLDTFSPYLTNNKVLKTKFDKRYELLSKKFLNNIGDLCIHKLSNLTILKILNNRTDPKSKQLIMDKIFGTYDNDGLVKAPSKVLEFILTESPENHAGPLFIYKILSNPLLLNDNEGYDNNGGIGNGYQKFVIQQIRRLLLEVNIINYQPYKKLMDEVGLSSNRLNRTSTRKRSNSNQPLLNNNPVSNANMTNIRINNGQNMDNIHNGYQYNYPMMMNAMNYQQQAPIDESSMASSQNSSQPSVTESQKFESHTKPNDMMVMQQLEQLSLSSAAMGYNSNPGTPSEINKKTNSFF